MTKDDPDTERITPATSRAAQRAVIESRLQRQVCAVLTRLERDCALEIRDEHDILESIYSRYKDASRVLAKGLMRTNGPHILRIDGWYDHYANQLYREPNRCLLIELRTAEQLLTEYREVE